MIKVSVIVPVYNVEKYLKECMDSILSQNLTDIEVLCIDDGSTDSSLSILKDYVGKYNNISLFHQENKGPGAARNLGLAYVKGKYVMFMDADDYYPDSLVLKKLYEEAENRKASICGGNIVTHEGKNLLTHWFAKKGMWYYSDFQELYYFSKYMYNVKFLKDNDVIFPEYRRYEDPPFLVRAMLCAEKFYAIEDIVYVYRYGYKEIDYSADKMRDVLLGMKEICAQAKERNLNKLYDKVIQYMTNTYKNAIYKYIYLKKEDIAQVVNDIVYELDDIKQYFSIDTIEKYLLDCKKERARVFNQIGIHKRVIIYGAGKIGSFTLKYLKKYGVNVIGITVTKKTDFNFMETYEVKEITEFLPYKNDVLVIIGTGVSYQEEIKRHLYNLGFEYVMRYDYDKIKLIEELESDNRV